MRTRLALLGGLLFSLVALPLAAQPDTSTRGSRNVTVLSHLPLGGMQPVDGEALGRRTGHVEVEQSLDRPFAYVAQRYDPAGFHVIDLRDPSAPRVLRSITFPNASGIGGQDLKYFKLGSRYFVAQAYQFGAGGQANVGIVLYDVSGLPDASSVREVARINHTGGFKSLFAYKHSTGKTLLVAMGGGDAMLYDAEMLVAGHGEHARLGQIGLPERTDNRPGGYNDAFVGYHPDTEQDRFYGAGTSGYHIFDITDPSTPVALTSISSAAVQEGKVVTPSPDGRYLVAAAGYRGAPLRIYDLQPAYDGSVPRVRTAIGAWTADWRYFAENHEVRWPYVFVASLDNGFQMFNMRAPYQPYTTAFFNTWEGTRASQAEPDQHYNGAWDVEVRNADGLIAVTDFNTGLWLLRVDDFKGWEGRGWGMPEVSSAQHWDASPAER